MDDKTGTATSVQVQVRNVKLGIATFWSLEKFECKLAALKELYENNDGNKAADIFCDPTDEWEPDLSAASVSTFSRRRSRSFMKNRRISGCLSDVKLHSIQNISGSLNKSSICPCASELFIPGICKESVTSALDLLEQNHEGGKSIADNLLTCLFTIFTGVSAISKAYEQQDEDCQENIFFLDRAAQSYSIRIISAFDQLVVLTRLWLDNIQKCSKSVKTEEELKQEVKNLGSYLQLLLQGCSSDISSMVMEAWNKVNHTVRQIMKYIGHLAVLRRTDICSSEENSVIATSLQKEFLLAIYHGVGLGLETLMDTVQEKSRVVQRELGEQYSQNEIQNRIKDDAVALAKFLGNNISYCRKKERASQLPEEECMYQEIKKSMSVAAKCFELEQCLAEVYQIVSSTLQGSYQHTSHLRSCAEKICTLAGYFNSYFDLIVLPSANNPIQMPFMNSELDSLIDSLVMNFELEQAQQLLKPQTLCGGAIGTRGKEDETGGGESVRKQKGILKDLHETQSSPTLPGELLPSRIQWV